MDNKQKGGDIAFGDIKKKWENFWYHYKTQTIIALVLIITLTICVVQLVTREVYDYCIMYAGPRVIAIQDIAYMKKAVEAVADDFDKNGEVVVTFDDIVMLSPEDREAAAEEGAVFDPSFIQSSMTEYYQQIIGGDAVICMLSPYMYDIVRDSDGFLPLGEIFDVLPEAAFDEYGINLLETQFGQYFNGINDLPEDTVLCIRRLSTMAKFKGEAKTRKAHEANVELFRTIVGFVAPEDTGDGEPMVSITDIVDRAKTEFIPTPDALEGFFSDEEYTYYFPSIKSRHITVHYSDGTSENIKDAIAAGRVTIADLDKFEIAYYAEPKVTAVEYTAEFIRADSMDDGGFGAFLSHAENASTLMISSTHHIPIAHISSTAELASLCADVSKHYQTDVAYNDGISFDAKTSSYDDAFFSEKSLLILPLSAGSGSIRHEVVYVEGRKSPTVHVCIRQIVPEIGTCDMADWFCIIEVAKADIETALSFDAWDDK